VNATEQRFWKYVDKTENCWNWTGTTAGPGRYGHFHIGGGGDHRQRAYAHRYSYELHVGPIPEGMEIDHLCRNTRCVRWDHLEPVSHAENQRRRRGIKTGPYNVGDRCRRGHDRSEHTAINRQGFRYCRECSRLNTASHRRRRVANTIT
jgi:hypothetical protein